MPTKVEQSDLLMALYGRHGEAPLPVIAIPTPSEAFELTIEAVRIALKYMTPVILMSDNHVANSSEPWKLPDVDSLPDISVPFATSLNGRSADGASHFLPYLRDLDTFARPWAVPGNARAGTPDRRHRKGGRHRQRLLRPRQPSADDRQPGLEDRQHRQRHPRAHRQRRRGCRDSRARLGIDLRAIKAAANRLRAKGKKVAIAHLRYLNPFPKNLGEVVRAYPRVLIPELNNGQLLKLIRADFLIDAKGLNKVQGEPFKVAEIEEAVLDMLDVMEAAGSR